MPHRVNQRDRILRLFQSREGEWIPLYEILPLAAQYNARIKELREKGHRIENRTEHHDGVVFSWFRFSAPTGQAPLFTVGPEHEQRVHYLEVTDRRL